MLGTTSCPECPIALDTFWFRRHLHLHHGYNQRQSLVAAMEAGVPLKFQATGKLRVLFDLPGPCHFCREPVLDWATGAVHHIDQDRENNDLANLALCHRPCHKSYHSAGHQKTDQERQRRSASITAWHQARRQATGE